MARGNYRIGNYTATSPHDNAERGLAKLRQTGDAETWQVVIADDYHLQFDYDDCDSPPNEFYIGLNLLRQRLGMKEKPEFEVTPSRSGNCHVLITLAEPMSLVERVAWQSVCGSDQLREGISLINIHRGHANPVLLFERRRDGKDSK